MIKSEVKKKIDASATITNTMIVVIIVSRRVGQVTLLVSERTSCRNLNGLKAIVWLSASVVRRYLRVQESEQPSSAQPSVSRDEPPSGLDCSGDFEAAPDIRQNGPAAGGGYVLRARPKVKVRGNPAGGRRDRRRAPKAGTVGVWDQQVKMAGAAGLEPATTGFGDRYSTS